MPELPEIANLAMQLDSRLKGKQISGIEIAQPKCLNLEAEAFTQALTNAVIEGASNRGKWILVRTTRGYFLLNLGMGGEALLVTRATLPPKYRLLIDFSDGSCLSINFWWFGYAHYTPLDKLQAHPMVGRLGKNALDLTLDELRTLLHGQRSQVKSFLLDQSRIAGIGNAYIHDILYFARLHPQRRLDTLSEEDIQRLYAGIRKGLEPSFLKGGAFYEVDSYGNKGGFTAEEIVIGYREGAPCPNCGTSIVKIKTGSTSSFLCPHCQV